MSDYEIEDVYFDSDDDQSMQSTPSSRNRSGKGDNKRDHHNALERRRRDLIKDSFCKLRDVVPALQGEKASRAQILKKAAEYIQTMKKRNVGHQSDIDELRKLNKILEQQIMHAKTMGK
ncbi:Protein max, partial [Fragariocoptes setiger]